MTRPGRRPGAGRGPRMLWLAAALLLCAPIAAHAQETGAEDGISAVESAAPDTATVAPTAQPVTGVGDPVVAPRNDRAYRHVFLAFGIAWALMLGYVIALGRRFAAVERDLEWLRSRDGQG